MENNSDEHRVYESVDDRSLSWDLFHNLMEEKIQAEKG